MSSGPEWKDGRQLITIDEEEFNDVLKRVHELLLSRVERAHTKKLAKPSKRAEEKHIETVKDVFALTHMIELVEHMTEEIAELRELVDFENRHSTAVSSFEMFSGNKKDYVN
jgi:hypothetical protein